ncbi:nitroreductase family protein [Megalodesulfovibrio paquesii]
MTVRELVLKNRSCRRFRQNAAVPMGVLEALADLGRLGPSAGNKQPLKYILCNDPGMNATIFHRVAWAGYLKDWPGPDEGERPAAYIIVLLDTAIDEKTDCDHGLATQSILLGAVERGLAGCIIASVDREKLREELQIPSHLKILLVLALGEPVEECVLDPIGPDGDIKYWRDAQAVHHVPKRSLAEVLVNKIGE